MVNGAVEGDVDEAVLLRLVGLVGATPGPVFGKTGKEDLLKRLRGYNAAARHHPWLVLVDLDDADECAPPYREEQLPDPAPNMCFRVVVREIEAWLFADRERMAGFLSIARSRIPSDPEAVPDPKETMVRLARSSRRRDIREDMVPRPRSGRTVGPAYNSRLIEFVMNDSDGWRPLVAAQSSQSLARCLRCLRRLATG